MTTSFRGRESRQGGEQQGPRINEQIRTPIVRVIGVNGEQIGVMGTEEAIRMARDEGYDLVELSATAEPPVCRVIEFGKYKYEQKRKQREAKKRQTVIQIKEVKFRPKTEKHDFDFKMRHIRRFLDEGNKVRVTIVYRGREMTHAELGRIVLNRIVAELADRAMVEQDARMEGRRLQLLIAPRTAKP